MRLVAVRPGTGRRSPVAKEATYSVQSVTIDGANVVNVGEQRFRPTQGRRSSRWSCCCVRCTSGHGPAARLACAVERAASPTPDGRAHDLAPTPQGELVLQNLARGTYTLLPRGHAYAVPQECRCRAASSST